MYRLDRQRRPFGLATEGYGTILVVATKPEEEAVNCCNLLFDRTGRKVLAKSSDRVGLSGQSGSMRNQDSLSLRMRPPVRHELSSRLPQSFRATISRQSTEPPQYSRWLPVSGVRYSIAVKSVSL
jgi:hypothetical protein